MASKKVSLASLATQMQKGFASMETRMEKGFTSGEKKFTALSEDIGDIKHAITTKEQIIARHTQAIETELRDMNHGKLETGVANLEDKGFGKTRA